MSDIRIGISGWRCPPWREGFQPEGPHQHASAPFTSQAHNGPAAQVLS